MTPSPTKSCPSCGERYDADVLFCPQDGTPLVSIRGALGSSADIDPYVGLELSGQIRIKSLLGIGSMGRVYRAFQAGIDRDVAVKILHRELSGNAELVARFHREAKIASRLSHPNVVSVLMTGTIPQRGDPRTGGEMYLVMEYLDGISMLSALAAAGTGGALPLPRALHIVLQLCDAVGEAHAQGIVHRDLKPENVMLVKRGDDPDFVKVLDFGIARLDWADREVATQAGLIFGTAKYISPEGAEGKPVTPAADVYSIATMLYQCLSGRTPFEGESPVQLLVQHTHDQPPDLRSIPRASYVPLPIAALIMQNLSKRPDDRADDARAFCKDLYAAARASGLDPEEISRANLLYARKGAVKLPSKERTKSLELSQDLATKIGGIAASSPDTTPLPLPQRDDREPISQAAPRSTASATNATSTPLPVSERAPASEAKVEEKTRAILDEQEHEQEQAHEQEPVSDQAPRDSQLEPPSRPSTESTMHGTESSLSMPPPEEKRRARMTRIVALVLALLAVPMVVLIGGKQLGLVGRPADDSLEGRLEAARDAMRRSAWDAPPGENVKEILDLALAKWPDDPRVGTLRREAADRLVTDALGRKYAGDKEEALHLARIAVSLNPALTTAQHLVVELEGKSSAQDASPSASGATTPGGQPLYRPSQARPWGSAPGKAKDGKGAASGAPSAALPPSPSAPSAPTSTKPTPTDSPVLPPPPPPLPTDTATPPPTSTGKWL